MNYYLYMWRPNSELDCTPRELSCALQGTITIPDLEEVDFQFVLDAFERFDLEPAPFKPTDYNGFAPGGPINIQVERTLCGWCSHAVAANVINEFIDLAETNDCFVCDPQISKMIPDDNLYRAKRLEHDTRPAGMQSHLKDILVPWLRDAGFKGSYPWFYRSSSETLVLNFQGASGGGAIRINYGTIPGPADADAKVRNKQMRSAAKQVLGRSTPGDFWYIYQYASPASIESRMRSDIESLVCGQG